VLDVMLAYPIPLTMIVVAATLFFSSGKYCCGTEQSRCRCRFGGPCD
jgi:hypothetical protein